jgi:Glutathione S-transferase, C-terminal domain
VELRQASKASGTNPTVLGGSRLERSGYETRTGEMETLLAGREYLAEAYSFADIAFYLAQLFGARMGADMSEATPRLLQWRNRMSARPAVRELVGPMLAYLVSRGRTVPGFLSEFVATEGDGKH